MSGINDFNTILQWLFNKITQLLTWLQNENSIITAGILFIPVLRIIFRFIHKFLKPGEK